MPSIFPLPVADAHHGADHHISHQRYHYLLITSYYWLMAIRSEEYLVTTARDLGAALKFFRTAAGVTQVDAAEAMGIGQPYLSELEGGKFGSSLTHALRLLRFVGCEVIIRPREPRG
jgi:DNA-binding XRE family transcriptional regulator